MMIESIDHIQLAMPAGGEDAARAFYVEILGLPEIRKPPDLAARGGCWFERPPLRVHLGVDPQFVAARKAHPAFIVRDLPKLIEALRRNGYQVSSEEKLEGAQRVYTHDPFGNRIELMALVRPAGVSE